MDMTEADASCAAAPAPAPGGWKQWLRRRLFPWEPCELPKAPPEWKDCFVCRTECTINFRGRLVLLFSGNFEVETRTVTENVIGKSVTATVSRIMPPDWLNPKPEPMEASRWSRAENIGPS